MNSHIHNQSHPLHPFLFMGCWNRRGTPRDRVAAAIQSSSIENVVLGGDNVYPLDGTKKHNNVVLYEGVNLLSGKRIYSSLGNHNVKNKNIESLELSLMDWTLPSAYYVCIFSDNYALVVLDTNIVEETEKYNMMIKWFSETIKDLSMHGIKYYVVQHEPYASYKKAKRPVLPNGSKLLYEMKVYPPIAILCADTHNYQVNSIDVNGTKILQYVVGTGGASYDTIIGSTDEHIDIASDIKLKMINRIEGFGYLQVTVDEMKFIKVAPWSIQGGGKYRKTQRGKYRNRYTQKTKKSRIY